MKVRMKLAAVLQELELMQVCWSQAAVAAEARGGGTSFPWLSQLPVLSPRGRARKLVMVALAPRCWLLMAGLAVLWKLPEADLVVQAKGRCVLVLCLLALQLALGAAAVHLLLCEGEASQLTVTMNHRA